MALLPLVEGIQERSRDLIRNVVDVGAAHRGCDRVYERDLLEGAIRNRESNLPSWVGFGVVNMDRAADRAAFFGCALTTDGLRIQLAVGFEVGELDLVAVEVDL